MQQLTFSRELEKMRHKPKKLIVHPAPPFPASYANNSLSKHLKTYTLSPIINGDRYLRISIPFA
jgi:hypothetical protein